ncbi:MAG: transcription elongation factor GreAB [Myxococcota bacterium]
MDKGFLVQQLAARLQGMNEVAARTAAEARDEAKSGAQRAVNLSRAHAQRSASTLEAVHALESFRPKPWVKGAPVGLGALVEVESDSGGRTLFLAPVGGGAELEGPGGDGLFHVVTPTSPLGRAVMGKRPGAVVEVLVQGEVTEWTITWVG